MTDHNTRTDASDADVRRGVRAHADNAGGACAVGDEYPVTSERAPTGYYPPAAATAASARVVGRRDGYVDLNLLDASGTIVATRHGIAEYRVKQNLAANDGRYKIVVGTGR